MVEYVRDSFEQGTSEKIDTVNAIEAAISKDLRSLKNITLANVPYDSHDHDPLTEHDKIIQRIEKEKREIAERDSENMEFQKKNFLTVDRWYLHRNIILLRYDSTSNIYYMKRVCPGNTWNTEWKEITKKQFESPKLIMEDRKYGWINEHILIVDGKVKKIDYKKAKKFLDQKKIKEKQDTMKKTEWQPQNNKPQNNKPQEKKELPPVKWVVKNKFFQV